MTLTLTQVEALKPGNEVHYAPSCKFRSSKEGKGLRMGIWRVSGRLIVRKKTGQFRLPLKYGLNEYTAIERWNIDDWHLPEECPERPREEVRT
jgi:hypothetical protein